MIKKIIKTKNIVENSSSILNFNKLDDEQLRFLQKILLDMYKDVVNYCEKLDIDLFLVGGSALGAKRHEGFIPWDDDMDLGLMRKDYEIFIKNFPSSQLKEKYIMKVPNSKEGTINRFMQIYNKDTEMKTLLNQDEYNLQMAYIDIFPYDNVPENIILRNIKGYYANFLMAIASSVGLYKEKNKNLKKIYNSSKIGGISYKIRYSLGFIFSFYSKDKWFNILDKYVQQKKDSKFITNAMGSKLYIKEIFLKKDLLPLKNLEFNGLKVNVPNNIDAYLKHLYGDSYMKIPDVKVNHDVIMIKVKEDK